MWWRNTQTSINGLININRHNRFAQCTHNYFTLRKLTNDEKKKNQNHTPTILTFCMCFRFCHIIMRYCFKYCRNIWSTCTFLTHCIILKRKQFNEWATLFFNLSLSLSVSRDCAYLIWLKVIYFIEIFLMRKKNTLRARKCSCKISSST